MWVTLLLTLVLGMSLGVMLNELVLGGGQAESSEEDRRGGRTNRFKNMLERELDLSAEQTQDLEKVLGANDEKARDFWKQTRSAYAELRTEFRQEIRALLTPEQQKRFDEMMAKHDKERHQRRTKKR
jgi:Spy/CpxP family protein refolding chaperone